MMHLRDGQAIYVYGFCHLNTRLPEAEFGGQPGQPRVEAIKVGRICVIASFVSRQDFEGEQAEANLKDPLWLTPRLYNHALVLEKAIDAGGAVYPVGFGTLFSSVDALKDALIKLEPTIRAQLDRIEGCEEWALDIEMDEDQALDMMLQEGVSRGDLILSPSLGRRHLEMQRYRSELRQRLPIWLAQHLRALREALGDGAEMWSERQVKPGKVANWAFLVRKENIARFKIQIDATQPGERVWGLSLRLTGPWPAYSFCDAR